MAEKLPECNPSEVPTRARIVVVVKKGDRLLTPLECELTYGIGRQLQAVYRHKRRIPFIMVGPRSPRYRLAELEAWIAARNPPKH